MGWFEWLYNVELSKAQFVEASIAFKSITQTKNYVRYNEYDKNYSKIDCLLILALKWQENRTE